MRVLSYLLPFACSFSLLPPSILPAFLSLVENAEILILYLLYYTTDIRISEIVQGVAVV